MIYRINNPEQWRSLLVMLQTKYKQDVSAWASRNEPGDNSMEGTVGDIIEDICEDSEGCLEVDRKELNDKLYDLYWGMQMSEDDDADYDAKVVDVCMEHVRPKYPVFVSLTDLCVSGGREPWVEHPIFVVHMQSVESADADPSGYPDWRWRNEGHCDVDLFVERIRSGKWHVTRCLKNIPLTGDIPEGACETCDTEDVLARILKDRACFDKHDYECGNIAMRLDVGRYTAEACWVDDAGTTHCYLFQQDNKECHNSL